MKLMRNFGFSGLDNVIYIGSNGKMVGYGSGIWRKEWLLAHERRYR